MLSSTFLAVSLVAAQAALAAPIAKPEVYVDTFKTSAGIACTAATGSQPECVTHFERDVSNGADTDTLGTAPESDFPFGIADLSTPEVILPRDHAVPDGAHIDTSIPPVAGTRFGLATAPPGANILPREEAVTGGAENDYPIIAPSLDDLRFGHAVPSLPGKTLPGELPPANSSTCEGDCNNTSPAAETSDPPYSSAELEARQLAVDVLDLLTKRIARSLSELD